MLHASRQGAIPPQGQVDPSEALAICGFAAPGLKGVKAAPPPPRLASLPRLVPGEESAQSRKARKVAAFHAFHVWNGRFSAPLWVSTPFGVLRNITRIGRSYALRDDPAAGWDHFPKQLSSSNWALSAFVPDLAKPDPQPAC